MSLFYDVMLIAQRPLPIVVEESQMIGTRPFTSPGDHSLPVSNNVSVRYGIVGHKDLPVSKINKNLAISQGPRGVLPFPKPVDWKVVLAEPPGGGGTTGVPLPDL